VVPEKLVDDAADDMEDPDEEDVVVEGPQKGGGLVNSGSITDSFCSLITIGALKCEKSNVEGACKCHFRGAKPITCADLFNMPNKEYTVFKNTKTSVFLASGCDCSSTTNFPVKSECNLRVGEIRE